ncbi:MAG: RNA ligase family protein, partial [Lachnospiraceae bacterium]|nr:RNA ligase family protein [Lachnospiraceae bacterium]
MEQKKYIDIQRLKPSFSDSFEKGDNIVVQEKIDGANFSIRYDESDNSVKAFSRKTELNVANNLRGAWEWSQKLDVNLVKEVLGNNLILFMEWLV